MILSWAEAGQEQEFLILPRLMFPRSASAGKSQAGVKGWVTALVFPHCSVIFLHFPRQPVALCTRHWPSACVQSGTLLNLDKSSWWDRNWANGHKESTPSCMCMCMCGTCGIGGCLLLPWHSWTMSWWHAYTKTRVHTLSSFGVIRQIESIDCSGWHFSVMCKEPYCVYLEPEIDRWKDGERRGKRMRRKYACCGFFFPFWQLEKKWNKKSRKAELELI